jgi:predicted DNA-binding protein
MAQEKQKYTATSVLLPTGDYEALRKIAYKKRIRKSDLIREAVEQYLKDK